MLLIYNTSSEKIKIMELFSKITSVNYKKRSQSGLSHKKNCIEHLLFVHLFAIAASSLKK